MNFEIKDKFYLDGKPFQILSGAIHYFRVHPEYWLDRLEKLKNMGLNAVETYIPWNFHEEEKGKFDWDGWRNVEKFLDLAHSLGLYAIVRPSPFICAEWEWGGLPAWLLFEEGMRVRSSYQPFLDQVRDYYDELIPRLALHQIDKGGNIILVQLENEYGYFGNDKTYLRFLSDLLRSRGITVPFVTADGPWGEAFRAGSVEGALSTGNFGSDMEKQFSIMKSKLPPDSPLMCMEFWVGWFDSWGNKKKARSSLKQNLVDFEYAVKNGHNLNLYMFHGGTNFGFMNGSNWYGKLVNTTTSYDYDAPLSEDGRITKKYEAFRSVIQKYKKIETVPLSSSIKRFSYGEVHYSDCADLFENLDFLCQNAKKSPFPISMEQAQQNTGYILYRTKLLEDEKVEKIALPKCADRVHVFSDGKKVVTAFDREIGCFVRGFYQKEGREWKFDSEFGAKIDFLVENMGRVNFGQKMTEQRKGIFGDVFVNGHAHSGWDIFPLPLKKADIFNISSHGTWNRENPSENPAFFRFFLFVNEACDTFLDFSDWGKGVAFVNGFNIGRFFDAGPQKRLYIPAPLFHLGKNEIILFETEGKRGKSISFFDEAE